MKRNSYIFISLLLSVVLFTSCITEDEYDNSPEGNFEALWQTIDRQYCFLDYKKQEYGLDWNEIYSQYKQRISKGMNNEQLFEVLADMLNELRDGHVNLSSKLEYSQYREWFDSYPANFSDSIQRVYLGKDYAQSSGMKYQIFEDNIAYIYCGSFQSGIGEGNLRPALLLRTAQRLVCPLLGQPHVRCGYATSGIRYRSGHQSQYEFRGYATQCRYHY